MTLTVSVSLDINPVWFEGRDAINYGVRNLDKREFDIFSKYFLFEFTAGEISEALGISRSRAFQLIDKVRKKVKNNIGKPLFYRP